MKFLLMNEVRNLIIIGSGPAGLTAAIYSARANLSPLVFGNIEYGGQLMNTTVVENFPGFPEGIIGPTLIQNMIKQAKKFGAEILYKHVDNVDFSGEIKKVWVEKQEFQARAIIIATGSSARRLGLENEQKLWGKGISTCATCDGPFYKGKVVAIIGGGDSAMEEANFLTKFALKIFVINRRDKFRASKIMQNRILSNPKIEVLWNSEVKDVLGDKVVTGLKLFNNKSKKESEIKVDGIFLAIGHIPNTKFLGNAVELDEAGYVKVFDTTKTSVDGIFVAGDVKDFHYKQAITASGMGCMAAIDAEKWLEKNGYDV